MQTRVKVALCQLQLTTVVTCVTSVTRRRSHDSLLGVMCHTILCLLDHRMFAHLDDPPNDELAALGAAGRVQDVETVLAVLAALRLEEDVVPEGSEALGADEAAVAEQLAITTHDLRIGLEVILAAGAGDAVWVDQAWHD